MRELIFLIYNNNNNNISQKDEIVHSGGQGTIAVRIFAGCEISLRNCCVLPYAPKINQKPAKINTIKIRKIAENLKLS